MTSGKGRLIVRLSLAAGALALVGSCGGSTHVSGGADAGGAETSVLVGSDAAACFIEATNYDQSCSVDSDCVPGIQSGDYCQSIDYSCGQETINKNSLAQYMADVAKTPVGSGAIPELEASCGFMGPPCCTAGHCTPGLQCSGTQIIPPDAGPSGAEDSAPPQDRTVMCGLNIGTFDAGTDAGGPWRWCQVGENCVPFNGGWACCMIQPSGGLAICAAPLAGSAGN
jgi:hypothetical protein